MPASYKTLPGGAALVVLELDLAINPVVAVRVAAIDLPGFGHDESRVVHKQRFSNSPESTSPPSARLLSRRYSTSRALAAIFARLLQ